MCTPTGMSSCSASAKYWSTDMSLGDFPSYWSPISPITWMPPLVNNLRISSTGTYPPCVPKVVNDAPVITLFGEAAFHLRTVSGSPITTETTLSRSYSASIAFM